RRCVQRSAGRISRPVRTRAPARRPTSTASPRTGCAPWDTWTDARTVGARLLVIGLDGATFDLVARWAAAGELPALARLMAAGTWGPLESTLPPATFPAWTSLVTGVNPGRHRVLDFGAGRPGPFGC